MQRLCNQKGFSLIELMVSLLIGMITVVVIMQVMAFSEGQKRTTTTGSDAQVNGNLALFTIEREAKNAGWGMVTAINSIGCPIKAQLGTDAATLQTLTLAPVTIADGPSGAPDTIRFLASTKSGIALPTRISVAHSQSAANFFVDSDIGINQGDLMVAVPKTLTTTNWCTLVQVTNDPTTGSTGQGGGQGQDQVIHNSGAQGAWNQPGGQSIFPVGGYQVDDYLINLGALSNRLYSIETTAALRGLQLTTVDFGSGTTDSLTTALYPNLVDLQALYGKDTSTPADGVVDVWDAVTPTGSSQWQQIIAIRVAVLSRSVNPEKKAVTFTEPTWNGGTKFVMSWDASTSVWGDESWKHYRYKVYENVMPIQNMVWRQQ